MLFETKSFKTTIMGLKKCNGKKLLVQIIKVNGCNLHKKYTINTHNLKETKRAVCVVHKGHKKIKLIIQPHQIRQQKFFGSETILKCLFIRSQRSMCSMHHQCSILSALCWPLSACVDSPMLHILTFDNSVPQTLSFCYKRC